jgi:hypothetical protein
MPEPGDSAAGNMAGSGGLLHREGQFMRIALGDCRKKKRTEWRRIFVRLQGAAAGA